MADEAPPVTILADPHHTRSDLRMIARAIKQRWPTTDEIKAETVQRMREVVNKRTVTVLTKEGTAALEGPADSNAVAAARVLERMEAQNQADEHKLMPDLHQHDHEHTVTLEQRRTRLLEIAHTIGERVGIAGDREPVNGKPINGHANGASHANGFSQDSLGQDVAKPAPPGDSESEAGPSSNGRH